MAANIQPGRASDRRKILVRLLRSLDSMQFGFDISFIFMLYYLDSMSRSKSSTYP